MSYDNTQPTSFFSKPRNWNKKRHIFTLKSLKNQIKTSYFDSFSPLWRKNKRWKKSVSDLISKVLCDVSAIFVAKSEAMRSKLRVCLNFNPIIC